MVQRTSQEVAWDRILAAEDAKRVESKPRVEVEEVLTQRHGVREAQSFWRMGFLARIHRPKAVRRADALARVSSEEQRIR